MVKDKKKDGGNASGILLFILLLVVVLLVVGCRTGIVDFNIGGNQDNNSDNDTDSDSGSDDSSTGNDGVDSGEGDDYVLACGTLQLGGFGDFGPVCATGSCDSGFSCDHYWNWDDQVHKCGCTETNYCGQYCFVYFFSDTGCECPPNSEEQTLSRSTYQCVPNNHFCEDGVVMDDVGPFPEP